MKILKNKRENILVTLFLIIFSTSFLSACSSSSEEKNVPVKDISSKIGQVTNVSNMKEGNIEKLKKIYGIDLSEVDEFVLYTASSNIKADEIVVIKVKDSSNVEDIKEKISKRVEKQGTIFKDYAPDEYFLIQKHVLKVNGKYILLSISKDSEKIENTFDEFFK